MCLREQTSSCLGNGSKVTFINGTTTLGTITLGQNLNRSGLKLGWQAAGSILMGIDNLSIEGTAPAVSVVGSNQSGGNPFTPSWTAETPSLIATLSPSTASGNFGLEGSGSTPVLYHSRSWASVGIVTSLPAKRARGYFSDSA